MSVKLGEASSRCRQLLHVWRAVEIIQGILHRLILGIDHKGNRGIHQPHVIDEEEDDVGFYRACPPLEGFAFRPSAAGACTSIGRPLLSRGVLALRALGRGSRMLNGE